MTTNNDLIFAELAAMRLLLGALINTHHDKDALLTTLDALTSLIQVENAASGGAPLPDLVRERILAYRGQIR